MDHLRIKIYRLVQEHKIYLEKHAVLSTFQGNPDENEQMLIHSSSIIQIHSLIGKHAAKMNFQDLHARFIRFTVHIKTGQTSLFLAGPPFFKNYLYFYQPPFYIIKSSEPII